MNDPRVTELVDRAFDYRGYVTLRRKDGSELVGFVYDRGASYLELFDQTATRRVRVAIEEIADIALTGEDTARKSQEIWERRKGTLEPRETPALGGWDDSRPILILVALGRELRCVARAFGLVVRGSRARGRFEGSDVVALAVGLGGGSRNAVVEERPRLIVSCGFSGGLDPSLAPGDVVLATSVIGEDGDDVATTESLRTSAAHALRGLRYSEGKIVCTTEVATTPEEKRALARTGALAVDMESYPAARAAVEAGVPLLALRAVLDPLGTSLPAFTREPQRFYLGPALVHALSGPRAVVELLQLAGRARRAAASLESALRRVAGPLASVEAHA
jgi:nucleoside phosphorylase